MFSTFCGFTSTTGSGSIGSITGSTGSFIICTFAVGVAFALDFAFGFTYSCAVSNDY